MKQQSNGARIALINVFFGSLPPFLPAFLISCRYNPEIDWLLFTDTEATPPAPANVRFIHLTVDDFNARCAEHLPWEVGIDADYVFKICDFRPAHGEIFSDYLASYEFWGHCDLDIVWGDIQRFVDVALLDQYDIISSRVDKLSGPCTLFRNHAKMNNLFRKVPQIHRYLGDRRHYSSVDEKLMTRFLQSHACSTRARMTNLVGRAMGSDPGLPRVYWRQYWSTRGRDQRDLERTGKCLRWVRGRAYDNEGREKMFLHFHLLKKSITRFELDYGDDPSEILISDRRLWGHPHMQDGLGCV